jgi:hypothetical protein
MKGVRIGVAVLCSVLLAGTVVLLGVAISLSRTILNADFVIAELASVPVYGLFADEAAKQVPAEGAFLLPLIDEAGEDLEPWAGEQVAVLIRATETYVKGDMAFSATISLEEPKRYLAGQLEETFLDIALPGLNMFSEEQQRMFLDQIMREVDNRIPDSFEVTEAYLDAGTLAGLRTAREYAGYVSLSLWLLPVVALVLVLLIAWMLAWRGRSLTRFTGAAFAVGGIGSLILRVVGPPALVGMVPPYIPSGMRPVVVSFIEKCFEPLLVYGIVVLVVGALLVLVSFRLRSADA